MAATDSAVRARMRGVPATGGAGCVAAASYAAMDGL